jgi:hypothetical protein
MAVLRHQNKYSDIPKAVNFLQARATIC